MKYIYIIILVTLNLIINHEACSQFIGQKAIDSLEAELPKAKKDTGYVNLLCSLAYNYQLVNPIKSSEYAKKAIDISKTMNWKRGLGTSLYQYGMSQVQISQLDSAESYIRKSLEIAGDTLMNRVKAGNYNGLGIIYSRKSELNKALNYFELALKIEEEIGEQLRIAGLLNNIGMIYGGFSDYPRALDYFYRSLKITEELGNKNWVSNTLAGIAAVYQNQKDYNKSLEYYNRTLKISKEQGNRMSEATCYNDMGIVKWKQGLYQEAIDLINKSLELNKGFGDELIISFNYGNLGNVYRDMLEYNKAMDYYNRSLEIKRRLDNKHGIAFTLSDIGRLYFELSQDSIINSIPGEIGSINLNREFNLNLSIDYLIKSAEMYEEIGSLTELSEVYNSVQKAYAQIGNMDKAYEYTHKHLAYKDSVFSVEKQKEISRLIAERDKAELDQKIKEEKRIEAEKIYRRNIIQYSGISILVVLLFISLFVIPKYNVSLNLIDGLVFVSFLLLFEFILVFTEPWVDDWTDQIPIYKLGINFCIALLFIPFHNIEKKLRARYTRTY